MTHPHHRPPREELSSPLVDEPGSLPIEPDDGIVMPGETPDEDDAEGPVEAPQ